MLRAQSLKTSRRHRLPVPADAEFSASGKYRRRGPRNRFSTDADRESEVDRIIALKTQGLRIADIANALKMSAATIYRRINSIKSLVPLAAAEEKATREKRAVALLDMMRAETTRAHVLGTRRIQKRANSTATPNMEDALAIEAIRLAADLQKAELEYLKHMGVFEAIRKEGRASEVLQLSRMLGQLHREAEQKLAAPRY